MQEKDVHMNIVEYSLEIYQPGSIEDIWVSFSSQQPFMPINTGDIINPGIWTKSPSPIKVLRVVSREHIIWESQSKIKHKICIFTEEVDGTLEVRLNK
jgi:hypothetical protein